MAGMSLDGMVSGLDTSGLVRQLMQVEAIPQNALKNKITVENKAVSAYQSVNSKMSSLLTAARAMTSGTTWTAMKASSTSDAVAVSAKPGAASGSLTFKVDKLAATHTVTFAGRVSSLSDAATAPVISGGSLDILMADGSTKTLTPTDRSMNSVVKSINDTVGGAYKAAAVQVAPGQYTLQLTATASGATSPFAAAFANPDPADNVPAALSLGAASILTQGADAQLTVGTTSTFTMTSTSNTFADILPGVTVTAAKVQGVADAPVTVSVAADKDGIAAKVQAMVDAANSALGDMKAQSIAKNGNVPAGPLVGDSLVRQLSQDILSAVSGGAGASGSLATVGIKLDKGGKLVFEKEKFLEKFTADPAGAQKFFDAHTDTAHIKATAGFEPGWDVAVGLGRKFEALAAKASEGVVLPTDPADKAKEGLLGGMIKRRNSYVGNLNDQIANWDRRLASREAALKKQFSGLETSLGKMKQQSSWLAGQIASLG